MYLNSGTEDLLTTSPILSPTTYSTHCTPLLNSENELNLALQNRTANKMFQLNSSYQQQPKNNVVEALTNVLSMNQNNQSNIALATCTANALRLNNNSSLDAISGRSTINTGESSSHYKQQTNGSSQIHNQNRSAAEIAKMLLKKSNNERKYPCGFPGCHWVFTRSNHVVRHQRRIHGLKIDKIEGVKVRGPRTNSIASSSNSLLALNRNQLNQNLNLLMMSRKLNHDYTRLKRSIQSKNSLLSSMCNVTNDSNSGARGLKIARASGQQATMKFGNIRRFQCNVDNCGQKFSNELLFNNHLKLSHNVDRNLINKNVHRLNQQNTSLNNLNSIKNMHSNQMTSLLENQELNISNNPKVVKNNMNAINNHIKLFLSNKTQAAVTQPAQDQESLNYLNNLNRLKLIQSSSKTSSQNSMIQSQQQSQITTKMNTPNTTISLQPKMLLSVSSLNNSNNLNTITDQQNKPLLITQIQLPTSNQINTTDHLITTNSFDQSQQQIHSTGPTHHKLVIFKCEIRNCLKCFTTKDNLVDHLFDDHRVFEPEIIVDLENKSENWLLLDDPKDSGVGLALARSNSKQDYRPCRMARSGNEPSLASTFGIVKDVYTKIDNVNMLNNIAATSSTTYGGLTKQHQCNINQCTKSFTKRYHLVRHRLEAHNVGKLSLMEDILNANNQQQQAIDLEIEELNNSGLVDKSKQLKKENSSPKPKIEKKIDQWPSSINNNNTSLIAGGSSSSATASVSGPFYLRRPPQDTRPYPCKYPKCNWSFKRAYHLKRHIRTHKHYYANCPEEPPQDFQFVQPIDEDEDDGEDASEIIELNSSLSSGHSVNNQITDNNNNNDKSYATSIVDDDEDGCLPEKKDKKIESYNEQCGIKDKKENLSVVRKNDEEIQRKPTRVTRSVDQQQQLLVKKEQLPEESQELQSRSKRLVVVIERNIQNKKEFERKPTRQQVKLETVSTPPVVASTDEENSSDLSSNQQIIQCEFSNCGKRFKRQRQYDLHVKTHLNEKPNKKIKIDENETIDLSNELEENSSEERYSIVDTSGIVDHSTRSIRTRNRTNHLNNNHNLSLDTENKKVPEGHQQLLLLCSSKEPIIFLNNADSGKRKAEKHIFVCDVNNCGKRFGRNCELTRHKLNHMDFWPYCCSYASCGKKFKRKDVFKNHTRTHEKNGDKIDD